ncbi:MAG: hypothetical protein WBM75_07575 [Polyangiales bacterium]
METKSTNRDTPCQVLLRWFRSLPNRLGQQIAGYVVDGSPHMRNGSGGGSGRSIDALTSYLGRCLQEPFQDAMGAASVAGMIDVLFASRSTREDWDRTSKTQERLVAKALREGERAFAAFVRDELSKLDSHADEWCGAARTWSDLRRGYLSPRSLDRFILGFYSDDQVHDLIRSGKR